MHPRNPYNTPPDFRALSQSFPPLAPYVFVNQTGQPTINFKDTEAQRYLTQALLYRDFHIKVEIPPDRLCPAVPNRLNYILWIQDILAVHEDGSLLDRSIRGIDIGTGASVIYPLLGCSLSPNWMFIATDIDPQSLIIAERNVASNGLQNRIIIKQSTPQGTILRHLLEDNGIGVCGFVMCNPPFYASKDEVIKATEDKEFDPNAVCTGADVEMITEGGEVGFVKRMIEESTSVGRRCQWFTSLLGKHTSIASLVEILHSLKVDNYGVTEFIQGHTRRWGIIWSFGDARLPDSLVRTASESLHDSLPLRNTFRQRIDRTNIQLAEIANIMEKTCREVEGAAVTAHRAGAEDGRSLRVWAKENTWSRKARRRLEQLRRDMGLSANSPVLGAAIPEEGVAAVVLVIRCQVNNGDGQYWLEGTWLRGKDRDLFETLWSHLCRKILDHIMA